MTPPHTTGVPASRRPQDVEAGPALRTYVLDTSVLLSDPTALSRFDEHAVVLPIVVLLELEDKRHHGELGWAARSTLRTLEQLRETHGVLTEPDRKSVV